LAKIVSVVPKISSGTDRQTHTYKARERGTYRETYSSQYFATAPAGEVIIYNTFRMSGMYDELCKL